MADVGEVLNVSRHEHGLRLMQGLPPYKCSGCKGRGANIGYKCRSCPKFVLHRPCAALPDEHVHSCFPQAPFKFRSNTNFRYDCDGCGVLLRGFVFETGDKRGFVFETGDKRLRLHPLCMDLPREFRYSGHPDHGLQLVIQKEGKYSCTRCSKENKNWKYWCNRVTCRVKLDMNCVIVDSLGLAEYGTTQVHKPSRTKHALKTIGKAGKVVGGVLLPGALGVASNALISRGDDERGGEHGGGSSEEEAGANEPTGR